MNKFRWFAVGILIGIVGIIKIDKKSASDTEHTVPAIDVLAPTVVPISYQLQLERAQNFDSNHNADWQPIIGNFDGVEMVLVPAGCFMMGSTQEQVETAIQQCEMERSVACLDLYYEQELPAHRICFEEPFWIDRYEVTNEQFMRFFVPPPNEDLTCDFYPYIYVGYYSEDNRPREEISWLHAQHYCEHRGARLPTESEWEYAARGVESWQYPWGNEWDLSKVVGYRWEGTSSVGSTPAGASWVGALDMSGNVAEWTSSYYQPYPYTAETTATTTYNNYRVFRGSTWGSRNAIQFRSATRHANQLTWNDYFIGVRCARSN